MKSFADKVPARAKAKLAWWLLCSRAGGAGFDPGSLRRIQDYLRVSLKVQEPAYTNPLQKPEHYFPGLAANPWYEPDEFEWTAAPGLFNAHYMKRYLARCSMPPRAFR